MDAPNVVIWGAQELASVRRLRVSHEVEISEEYWGKASDGVKREVRRRTVSQLQEAALPYAVDINPDDAQVAIEVKAPNGSTWLRKIVARGHWSPRTLDAELRGGPGNGLELTLPNLWWSVVVPDPPRDYPIEFGGPLDLPVPEPIRYELSGWNATDRRWVLEPVRRAS